MYKYLSVITFSIILSANIDMGRAELVVGNLYVEKTGNSIESLDIQSVNTFTYDGIDVLYLFNINPTGFVLVPTDDRAVPVVGYSFDNGFDFDNYPPNLNYLLDTYKTNISNAIINDTEQQSNISDLWDKYLGVVYPEPSTRSVTPLLPCNWNQDSPWNDMCPEDLNGPGGNVYAGCVAISMVQIMYYWRYPATGNGEHGYNAQGYGYQFVDFEDQSYDYSLMEDYTATEESQKLIYHAGISVNMGYSPDGSGAWVGYGDLNAMTAMRDNFLYDDDIFYVERGNFNDVDYREMLYYELDNNRPVISRGCSNSGCHAWNLDGYDGDLVHNNLGWGGSSNGYYDMNSMAGFGSDHGMVLNIIPESLDAPRIRLNNYSLIETGGDLDQVPNPGETFDISIDISSELPWSDASNIDLILSSSNNGVSITNDNLFIESLSAGANYVNYDIPFSFNISDTADLGSYQLELYIHADGANGAVFEDVFYIDVDVSINQYGFPFIPEFLSIVESSPVIIDIDNDSMGEMFFGDKSGRIYGVNSIGEHLPGFSFQLEDPGANQIWGSPASADLDGDGNPEIVFTSQNGHLYIINHLGEILVDINTEQYLLASPIISNFDSDEMLEVAVPTFDPDGKLIIINDDGSYVSGFPLQIGDSFLRAGSSYDFNGNGIDDLVIASSTDNSIYIVYDDASISQIFSADDKFMVSPSVLVLDGTPYILVGNDNGFFYCLDQSGNLVYSIDTGAKIRSSVGFMNINESLGIVFGNSNGDVYILDVSGNSIQAPINIGGSIHTLSPVFFDVNGDGVDEIVIGSINGNLDVLYLDGTSHNYFPLNPYTGVTGSASISDIDNDGDIEILVGTNNSFSIIDLKGYSADKSNWNTYKGNYQRTGVYFHESSESVSGDLNGDGIVNVLDVVSIVSVITSGGFSINADLNDDGVVNILDVVSVINIILQS